MSHSPFVQHTLSNGLQVVIEVMRDVPSAAAGFFARTGGRDEVADQAGVSHFLEHMCFKGTPRRTWREITVELDELGSSYNAYTSKDRTFYYGWVPQQHIDKQIELLADMMASTLPQEEFDMEKNVVLEEIAMAGDSLENLAYDFMHEKIYGQHPLGWPVLGYDQTVRAMSREDMMAYFRSRYAANNLVLVVAGNVDPDGIIAHAEQLCGGFAAAEDMAVRQAPAFMTGQSCSVHERFNLQVIAAVYPAPGGVDDFSETADAVAQILGGDNSPFYWEIMQKGIAPRAGVWRVDYSECGMVMLYGECDPDSCETLTDAMATEAERMTREGVSDAAVQRVKNRRRTSLAVESEAPYYRLNQLLDDIDYRGGPRTVEQRLAEVDAITPETIVAYLEQYPLTTGGHFISVGPRDWLPAQD